MPYILAIIACALIVCCGDRPSLAPQTAEHRAHADATGQCHAELAVKDWTESSGERRGSLDFTLTLDGPGSIPVPYEVDAAGMPILGLVSAYNAADAGTGSGMLKLTAQDGWETIMANRGNQIRLGGIVKLSGPLGTPSSVSVAGQTCSLAVNSVAQTAPPLVLSKAPATPAQPPAFTAPSPPAGDEDALKTTVRGWIQQLMNQPRVIAASNGHAEETRGGPGNFEKLQPPEVDQFVAAIIDGGNRFYPSSISAQERAALVAVEISAESAFQPGTAGINPGNNAMTSVGPLQLTKEIWVPIIKQYAKWDGMKHFDGSPWAPTDTTEDMVTTSIYDNIMASLWCITEQGRRGGLEWFGGGDGPMDKVFWSGMYCWLVGAPAASRGDDLDNQKQHYFNMISTELQMIGIDPSLLQKPY